MVGSRLGFNDHFHFVNFIINFLKPIPIPSKLFCNILRIDWGHGNGLRGGCRRPVWKLRVLLFRCFLGFESFSTSMDFLEDKEEEEDD